MYCGAQQDNNGNRNIYFNAFSFTKAAPYATNFDVVDPRVLSGSNSLTKQNSHVLTVTGTNTYTGGTTISAGTLRIGNGSTTGVLPGNVTNNATLEFNRSDAVTYTGVISGSGILRKSGSNNLNLNGNNTYTGETQINQGTLSAVGTLSSSTHVYIGNGTMSDNATFFLGSNNTYACNVTVNPSSASGTRTLWGGGGFQRKKGAN